ncbi:hypothetical protein [Azotobacter armeniacus]
MDAWLAAQTPETMRATLRLLLEGRAAEAERELRRSFLDWQRAQRPAAGGQPRRRVAAIRARCEIAAGRRLERERQAREAEEARRRAERRRHLAQLAENAGAVWAGIDKTLQRGSGAAYDEALRATQALAEALAQAGRESEFRHGLDELQAVHGRRAAWTRRLVGAGLTNKAP